MIVRLTHARFPYIQGLSDEFSSFFQGPHTWRVPVLARSFLVFPVIAFASAGSRYLLASSRGSGLPIVWVLLFQTREPAGFLRS